MSKKYDRRRCMERKKRHGIGICIAAAVGILMTGCGGAGNQLENENISAGGASSAQEQEAMLEDGIYLVEFDTDSSMFHVNEACEGKGTLTVEDGTMTLHISLPSKNVVNLFPGLAEDAQKEGAALLQPTIDTVTYSDGMTEEVHGFDVPVPVLGEEFDLALLGTKGTWYDHKVSVSNPVMIEEESAPNGSGSNASKDGNASVHVDLEDGEYTINVAMEGGSGRASVASPATLIVTDGYADVRIEWSSPNYDYMKIGEETYTPVNTEGNSVFEFPVSVFDEKMEVIADTTAMGTPHEITYMLTFYLDSVEKKTLTYSHSMELDYAKGFSVDYYDGGYAMITMTENGSRFLVVPEGAAAPELPAADIVVLQQPVENIYLAASAVMDMFVSMDALGNIRLSGTKEDSWYVEEARAAMEAEEILYAGKYNMPDYELILNEDCGLAIESTMILHSPEVKEELESLGIPVLTDRSSYEEHPLGRTEWVKLYGVLVGREQEAKQAFDEQKEAFASVENETVTEGTVAFFYITSNGAVSVRKSGDYVPKMIELAGGDYIFSDLGDDTASSSVNMQMEEFYAGAKDADYLIYNSTIDGGVNSLEDLLGKSPLFADFKAYATGNVFCTTQNLYQESMESGTFILDLHRMFTAKDGEDETFRYLFRLR